MLPADEWLVVPPGRVMTKRSSGAKLLFYDVSGEGAKIQVMADLGCALYPCSRRAIHDLHGEVP